MKQKMLYIVLLVVTINLPAPSKECIKTAVCPLKVLPGIKAKTIIPQEEETAMLPVAPFSRMLFDL
jgi:hypothetical protein